MALRTRSKFYYNFIIENDSYEISFDEGLGELIAQMNVLAYTPTDLADEIARAMTAVGDNDYSCIFDRDERKFTITSLGGTFEILGATGTATASALTRLGFDAVDTGLALSHVADNATGSVYYNQFLLQDYIPFEDIEDAAYGTRYETAEGDVEDIRFGNKSFCEFNITYITDLFQPHKSNIENNPQALADTREFLRYITKSRPFEFMPDRADSNTFHEVILERTTQNRNGQGYKINPLYSKNLPDYYETGKIILRKR